MNYDETIKDIEKTLGSVPVFMNVLPENILIRQWFLMKEIFLKSRLKIVEK